VILRDIQGGAQLAVPVGLMEASAIAAELEDISFERPSTHALMATLVCAHGSRLDAVELYRDGSELLLARLRLIRENGSRVELDARPSDAIVLALHTGAPLSVSRQALAPVRLARCASHPDTHDKRAGGGFAGWGAVTHIEDRSDWCEGEGSELTPGPSLGKYKM